jgi:hypothetical protein
MQCRAKLISGREKRPRNADWPFGKVLVSGLRVRKVARGPRADSGGGVIYALATTESAVVPVETVLPLEPEEAA